MTRAVFTAPDKRAALDELAAHVRDGDCVAVGGGLSSREPMAVLRALLRAGRKGLRVVGSAHGIDIDLLCGGGAVASSAESYVGFEQDFGMAPNYRRAAGSGRVQVEDSCCYTIVQQLRAATMGVPFLPVRSVRGTDFESLHPEYKKMICPFTGEELLLVPALAPDVAILHAQYGDAHGNLRIEGPPVADLLFARAAKKTIATVERVVGNDELVAMGGASVPYFHVAAVAEVPLGAHPTACYPMYAYDRPHTAAYHAAAAAGPDCFKERYLIPFVHGCPDHATYLERIGGAATAARLASWQDGDQAWQRLYQGRRAMMTCSLGEVMIYNLARTVSDGSLVFHGFGSPLVQLALHLAKRTSAPEMVLVAGATYGVNPRPPFLTPTSNDWALDRGAEAALDIEELFDLAASGRMGRMFLSGAQIDRYGNSNVTRLGRERLALKLPGGGGGCNLSCDVDRITLWTAAHRGPPGRHRLVERCDFITNLGHRGADGRTRAELGHRGRGPDALVTDLGLFDFDEGGRLRLRALYPDTSVEDIAANTGFAVAAADRLEPMPLPDAAAVAIVRALNPLGVHLRELSPADRERRFPLEVRA